MTSMVLDARKGGVAEAGPGETAVGEAARVPASLHGELLAALRDYLVEGNLADGARVPERLLCDRFGISRTPLREALSAFVTKTQEHVTGTVRLKLYKGNMINAGVWSPYSLYSEEIATFGESDYNQADAAGFIQLYGLPIAVQAKVDGKSM